MLNFASHIYFSIVIPCNNKAIPTLYIIIYINFKEDTERSAANARSSCASSDGGRRPTLPGSAASFLKANERFVNN